MEKIQNNTNKLTILSTLFLTALSNALFPVTVQAANVLIFGDSHIKQGAFPQAVADSSRAYVKSYAKNGMQFLLMPSSWLSATEIHHKPNIIVIAFGTNEAMNKNIDIPTLKMKWIQKISVLSQIDTYANADVIILGAFNSKAPRIKDVQKMQKEVAQATHSIFIPQSVSVNQFQPDGIHLTAPNYRLLGLKLGKKIKNYQEMLAKNGYNK